MKKMLYTHNINNFELNKIYIHKIYKPKLRLLPLLNCFVFKCGEEHLNIFPEIISTEDFISILLVRILSKKYEREMFQTVEYKFKVLKIVQGNKIRDVLV